MNKEKRRKFHEALKEMLYPPPPPPSSSPPHHLFNLENPNNPDFDQYPDEFGSSSLSSSGDESECGHQKLTRAQRKRLRKKKMKEDASCRNGMIGPLLPVSDDPEGVRRNAAEKLCIENDPPGEPAHQISKVKNRRKAKKLAKEKTGSTIVEKSLQDRDCFSNIGA